MTDHRIRLVTTLAGMGIWHEPNLITIAAPLSGAQVDSDGDALWSQPDARVVLVSPAGEVSMLEPPVGMVDGASRPAGSVRGESVCHGSARGSHAVGSDRLVSGDVSVLDLAPTTRSAFTPATDLLLGRVGQAPVFARIGVRAGQAPVRRVLALGSDVEIELAMRAAALVQYHAANGYCPRCGHPTSISDLGRSRWCDHCQETLFPRLDPAIIVAITDQEDRLLLGHHSGWSERRSSVFAGFSEAGESLEQTVRREVAEEVGLTVDAVQYFGSQPWPMPRSLMVGFTAKTTGVTPHPDGEEITAAQWYSRAELDAAVGSGRLILPPTGSIAARLVRHWLTRG